MWPTTRVSGWTSTAAAGSVAVRLTTCTAAVSDPARAGSVPAAGSATASDAVPAPRARGGRTSKAMLTRVVADGRVAGSVQVSVWPVCTGVREPSGSVVMTFSA